MFGSLKYILQIGRIIIIASIIFWIFENHGGELRDRYQRWKYPSSTHLSPLSKDIERKMFDIRLKEWNFRYDLVLNKINKAREAGYEVSYLRRKLPQAKEYALEGKFKLAKAYLNSIEIRIPKKREAIRIASEQQLLPPHQLPDVKGKDIKRKIRLKSKYYNR